MEIFIIGYFLFFILFSQSGIDKIRNWKENLDWLNDYFSKTFLHKHVKLNLGIITFLELVCALFCGMCVFFAANFMLADIGIIERKEITDELIGHLISIFRITNFICGITFIVLFMGQRISKDYVGAVRIIPYFILLLILSMMPFINDAFFYSY